MALPTIESFKRLSSKDKRQVLDHLFEPCNTLSNFIFIKVLHQQYNTYPEFINLVRKELLEFLKQSETFQSQYQGEINPVINEIISAHPRLGEPKKETLSVHSNNEQKTLNNDPEIIKKLKELNAAYEKTFPGLRYVVFVNGRSRHEIMDNMQKRIERNDINLERVEAFNAMCNIALDRANKLGIKL